MGLLWALLPMEALPLLLMGTILAMILGLVGGRAILGVLGLLVFLPFLGVVTDAILGPLPPWVGLLLIAGAGLALLRGLAALLIGGRAADTMVGTLAADLVRGLARIVFVWPVRMVRWALRAVNGTHGLQ